MVKARHLYVHVPFCTRRCSYCDFSIAVRRVAPVDEFVAAIEREIQRLSNEPVDVLDTVYLGGGTPSRLGGDGIARLFEVIDRSFSIAPDAEITIEANPEDVTPDAARSWRSSGVNRVSLGVQSFDDAVLSWMHRVHDADAAMRAIGTLREAGFDNISIDLIFALPDSLKRSWSRDLEITLQTDPDHVSLYGLTIEDHTPLSRWETRGDFTRADEDRYARDFLLAHETMRSAGYDHYEVSNFGKPNRSSRHNSAYWTGAPYLGLGPSAHSFDGNRRWWNARAYAEWLARLDRGESVVADAETLTEENRNSERVYLGLRTQRGLVFTNSERALSKDWVDEGWAIIDDRVLRLTPEGWLRLDSLAARLTVS